MKYLVVIGDGMADNPVEALGGKTPLEYADIPTIDSLAARGTVGSVVNCPKPLPAGSGLGQFTTLPTVPRAARESMVGMSAYSRGVLPPRASTGLSAMPSPMTTRYFIGAPPYLTMNAV